MQKLDGLAAYHWALCRIRNGREQRSPREPANGTDVSNPARDCAFCQDASRLGDAVLDSAMLRGALTAGRIRRGRGGGLRRFARSRRWIASGFVARAFAFVGGSCGLRGGRLQ